MIGVKWRLCRCAGLRPEEREGGEAGAANASADHGSEADRDPGSRLERSECAHGFATVGAMHTTITIAAPTRSRTP